MVGIHVLRGNFMDVEFIQYSQVLQFLLIQVSSSFGEYRRGEMRTLGWRARTEKVGDVSDMATPLERVPVRGYDIGDI